MKLEDCTNIQDKIGCNKCARRAECLQKTPLLGLLVMMKADYKCEARVAIKDEVAA